MIKDAREDVEEACAALTAHLTVVPGLRERLLACRETLLWAAAFPEPVESFGFPTAIAIGLQEPVRRLLNTKARFEHAAILELLNEDATAIAEAFSQAQQEQLGVAKWRTPHEEGKWWDDPNDTKLEAWKRDQLERARELAEWGDRDKIAAEIRDERT